MGKVSKAAALASALGLSADEVTKARRVESSHSVASTGLDKAARSRTVAQRLGLTVKELEGLRRLLNGDVDAGTDHMVSVLRRVAGMDPAVAPATKSRQSSSPRKEREPKPQAHACGESAARGSPVRRPLVRQRKLRAEKTNRWTADTTVFVTDWGDRVHWRSDCSGISAFGKGGKVVQAKLADRICAGRSACEKCFGEAYSGSEFAGVGRLIDRLHGRICEDQSVRKQIAKKAKARFGAGASNRSAKGARSKKAGAVVKSKSAGSESLESRPMMSAKDAAAAERVNAERRAAALAELQRERRKPKGAADRSR